MGLLNPHLDDAAFAEVWAEKLTIGDAESWRQAETHLRTCADCRTRFAAFGSWLDAVRADAFAEADEAFNTERLAAQQAQITRRLEGLEHPAKVIAFPRFTRPIAAHPGGRRRWVAAAAAAGLMVGLGLGQLFDFGISSVRQPDAIAPSQQMARGRISGGDRPGMGVVTAASPTSDEVFLYDTEGTPSQGRVPESLQYLNAITPGARDVDPR
ncbi:MAG: hypothetical protein ACRD15_06075 [Vicinamibacterales bacterium]